MRFTDNFLGNLDSIENYWREAGFPAGYDRLLETLSTEVIPNLESYPEMGRPFARYGAESAEAKIRIDKLGTFYTEIREYLLEDYLLLYLLTDAIYMLAVKHHKQLSYDFQRLWLNQ
ncbi:type II toxin-antitoxin system RelE/ParE family toxin [Methylomonas sp. SURF-2]|uniref:Type II toxin-antitoxin system RelE/ParE family toxin n=1 Tax=Methylomonas subterranea TaxID=2952225 RepID=A0ABT1THD2_9GAMM|nr:type II toxin-antitoxin system RelE/ParE family toxin [Methylomonas sp. SURF-2]